MVFFYITYSSDGVGTDGGQLQCSIYQALVIHLPIISARMFFPSSVLVMLSICNYLLSLVQSMKYAWQVIMGKILRKSHKQDSRQPLTFMKDTKIRDHNVIFFFFISNILNQVCYMSIIYKPNTDLQVRTVAATKITMFSICVDCVRISFSLEIESI